MNLRAKSSLLLGFCMILAASLFFRIIWRGSRGEGTIGDAGSIQNQQFWVDLGDANHGSNGKIGLRSSSNDDAGVEFGGYPRRSIVDGPLSSSGLMEYADQVYGLDSDQVRSINAAVLETRMEIASLVGSNLEEVAAEDGALVFNYIGQPGRAREIRDRLYSQLRDIAGAKFAEAGVRVFWSSAWFLGAGEQDIRFQFYPRFLDRPEGKVIGGSYKISWGGSTKGGALEYLSPSDLYIDFNEVLRAHLERNAPLTETVPGA